MVEILIECLLEQSQFENLTVQMIVAILQKLSLKCCIRKKMIQRGIVEWLIKYLNQVDPSPASSTPYGLEYSTALFMNLCLHKAGKQKCFPMAKMVLEIMTHLLSSQIKQVRFIDKTSELTSRKQIAYPIPTFSPQILPYVNGTLYSLLSCASILSLAKDIGLQEKLVEVSGRLDDQDDTETKRQIGFLIGQLSSNIEDVVSDDDGYQDDAEEVDDEDVEIEKEVDLNDPVLALDDELSGNRLLEMKYSLEDAKGVYFLRLVEVVFNKIFLPCRR